MFLHTFHSAHQPQKDSLVHDLPAQCAKNKQESSQIPRGGMERLDFPMMGTVNQLYLNLAIFFLFSPKFYFSSLVSQVVN